MAFNARQVFPADLSAPRRAIGISLPFNADGVFTQNYSTKEAIKSDLINYLLTNPGERPGNPTFGAGLREYIFSLVTNDTFDFIKEDLQEKINQEFNNINLQDIQINQDPDRNTLYVSIYYDIPNTNIDDNLQLTFS